MIRPRYRVLLTNHDSLNPITLTIDDGSAFNFYDYLTVEQARSLAHDLQAHATRVEQAERDRAERLRATA